MNQDIRTKATAPGWKSFLAGAKATSPILVGVVPFAMIFGATAVNAGLAKGEAGLMSIIVFAGAAQLAAVQLMTENAPALVAIMTGLVINARFLMYSASIAPHFQGQPMAWKAVISYLLTDQAYVVSITRFAKDEDVDKRWFYLGSAICMWLGWNTSAVAGIVLGRGVPRSWSLEFAIPLTFLALLMPVLKDRFCLVAALVSAVTAICSTDLPYGTGLLLAAALGITAGWYVERKKS